MIAILPTLTLAAMSVPPPPMAAGRRAPDMPRLLTMMPGMTTCDGGTVRPIRIEPPASTVSYWTSGDRDQTMRVTFAIDAAGRPVDVDASDGSFPSDIASDVVPSLVVSRYPAGAARAHCTIGYTLVAWPVRAAPMDALFRFYALPHEGTFYDRQVFDAFRPEGATCYDPSWPAPRLQAFPAFEDIPQPDGTRSYAMIGFDLDRRGRPRNVHVVSSDGNRTFDRASAAAIGRSRFAPGARTGCLFPYRLTPRSPLPAPPMPPNGSAYDRAADTCNDLPEGWEHPPELVYPDAFRKRPIEGWAILRFDVAPWGEIGNVRVEKAEPAAAFGEQAKRVLAAATKAASSRGYSGCTQRVKFELRD